MLLSLARSFVSLSRMSSPHKSSDADEANEAALQRIKELTMMVAEAYEWRERMIWLEKEVLRLKQENEVNQLVAEEERSLLMSHHQQIRTPFSTLTRR